MRKKSVTTLLLFLFLSPAIWPAYSHSATKTKTIRVGIYQNKPLVFMDEAGNPQGIQVDLLRHTASREKWELKFVPCVWEECLIELADDRIDLMPAIGYSKARAELFDFSAEPVLMNWGVVYVGKNSGIRSLPDLEEKRVAVLRGDSHYLAFRALAEQFELNSKFVLVDTYPDVFITLQAGKADAGIVNRLFGAINDSGYDIEKTPIIFDPVKPRFAAPKGKSQDILSALDRDLRAMKADENSLYDRSIKNWLGMGAGQRLPGWLKLVFILCAVLVLLLGGGTVLLSTAVRTRTRHLREEIERRKRGEAVLRESEERYRTLFDFTSDSIFLLDSEGGILDVNATAVDHYGYSQEEFKNMTVKNLAAPDLVFRVDEQVRKVLDGGAMFLSRNLKKNGTEMQIEVHARPVIIAGRKSMLAVVRDITERKGMEEKLRRSEESLARAQRIAHMGNVDWNLVSGRIVGSDEAFRIFGLASGQFDGTFDAFLDRVHPEDLEMVRKAVEDVLKGKHVDSLEHRIVRPDGDVRYVSESARISFDESGNPARMVVTILDITERRKLEDRIRHAHQMESLGLLAEGIAHDFNNMLTGILGNASLAEMKLPPDSPAIFYTRKIINAAQQAGELANQMLAYSGKGRLVLDDVDLSAVIQGMEKILATAVGKNVNITYHLSDTLPVIEADVSQIRQVVTNLIINAAESIGDDVGVIVVTTGMMKCDRSYLDQIRFAGDLSEGWYVLLDISDTGRGMASTIWDRIFEPFFTTKEFGRGMGLAAVLGIVKGHGGGVRIQSEPERGATFRVLLPATEEPRDKPVEPPPEENLEGVRTVLVVDDEEIIRDLARDMLETEGFQVLTAPDGPEALKIFRNRLDEIDLVLLDMTMPKMGGDEVFYEMKNIRGDIPVILSSGYDESIATGPFESGLFAHDGLAGFIQKPYSAADLVRKIKKTLSPR
ncbi:MAG: PAS domain S-box protein [Deltaproteobacteria bacterium]|nr:PAS domain S-box protein [Deltaproteobacteria bacterium]